VAQGRAWEEAYDILLTTDPTVRGWLAKINQFWHDGITFTIDHRSYLVQTGVGGGSPLINGSPQTGSVITIDGCPNNTMGWLKAGDLVLLGSSTVVDELVEDANTNGVGQTNLFIQRNILSGQSPADNGQVKYGAQVTFRAYLETLDKGEIGRDLYLRGLRLGFREAP
jgi:hypothetical protein